MGRWCTPACRQAAHRARTSTAAPAAGLLALAGLDRIEEALTMPGMFAGYALRAACRALLRTAGRPEPVEPVDPPVADRPVDALLRPPPRPWEGALLPRPAKTPQRSFTHQWSDKAGWELRVFPLRGGGPYGPGQHLWRRQHPKNGHRQHNYLWLDLWGVPDTAAVHRLAAAMLADAIDLFDGAHGHTARTCQLPRVAAHHTGDVLWDLGGDRPWAIQATEIVGWLDFHHYLKPVT